MADLSQVSDAIVTLLSAALYPNGTSQPSAIGYPVKIFSGWPVQAQLQADLQTSAAHPVPVTSVSVYPQPSIERVTTRYPQEWHDQTLGVPTITAVVSSLTVTLGGPVTLGQYVTILVGNKVGSYAAQAGDTLSTMATALAALFTGGFATAVGPVITFNPVAGGRIIARIGAPGTVIRELRRQQRGYQVVIWAPVPELRTAVAEVIDPVLAATDFVPLPDGYSAWLTYRGTNVADDREPVLLYREDIFIWAEYPTTQVMPGYPITDFVTEIEGKYYPPPSPAPFGINTPGWTFTPQVIINN